MPPNLFNFSSGFVFSPTVYLKLILLSIPVLQINERTFWFVDYVLYLFIYLYISYFQSRLSIREQLWPGSAKYSMDYSLFFLVIKCVFHSLKKYQTFSCTQCCIFSYSRPLINVPELILPKKFPTSHSVLLIAPSRLFGI